MKRLILITDVFPFGKGEKSFILPELEYLKKEFKVTVLSRAPLRISENEEDTTMLDPEIEVLHYPEPELTSKIKYRYLLSACVSRELFSEIIDVIKDKKSFYCIKETYLFWLRSVLLEKWMEKNNLFKNCGSTIFYSYWANHSVLTLSRAKKKDNAIKFLSRIHGYDLYHERFPGGRQPFKKYIDAWIDKVVFIAKVGYEYYMEHHSINGSAEKYSVCRMGVRKPIAYPKRMQENVFRIVSCSAVSDLKRVDLIVRALGKIDFEVEWHHFGDGREMEKVTVLAEQMLNGKQNISYYFHGHTLNKEVLEFYQNNWIDCFITTSSSEGCPVSIQEALSYGIPIIGTDVGEIKYMISGNGFLLPANPTEDMVAKRISDLYENIKDDDLLRQNSLDMWKKYYQLEKNTYEFIDIINNI